MRTDLEIFEMYKEEKAHVVGSLQERTGLEPFPTFKNWKEAYIKDYLRNHVEVSAKEADRLMDAAVELAEEELELLEAAMAEGEASKAEVEEAGIRVAAAKEKAVEAKEKAKAERKAKRAKRAPRKSAAKKTVVKKAKGTGEKRTVNKAAIARDIFKEMYPKVEAGELKRKDVIAKFLEAGLTAAGASTYYQRYKKENNTN